jgi:Disulphide bond corrector protein DsbC
MKIIILWVWFAFLCGTNLFAQTRNPVKSDYKLSKKAVKKGGEVTLIFTLNLDQNWHVYSNIQNYELGPMRTSFSFEPNSSYELLGGVIPVGSRQEHEPVFEVDVNYFESRAEFRQKIKVFSDTTIIKGIYRYQLCNPSDGICLYRTENFEFNIATVN